jgi:hypothetical protein
MHALLGFSPYPVLYTVFGQWLFQAHGATSVSIHLFLLFTFFKAQKRSRKVILKYFDVEVYFA